MKIESLPAVVVFTTFPDEASADTIVRKLVEEGLAACISRFPVRSVYRWKGKIEDDPEVFALLKTHPRRVEALRERLLALHPYEVPEFLVLPVLDGHGAYLSWLEEVTRP